MNRNNTEQLYKINGINGPVVTVAGRTSLSMGEMVYVGEHTLIGEVISITDKHTTIQVYESTTGLKPSEPVRGTSAPITVTLGPGLLGGIYDGIARPLDKIFAISGDFIAPGVNIPSLDADKKWDVTPLVKVGDTVRGGMIFASCPEGPTVTHRIPVPPDLSGTVAAVTPAGSYTVNDTLAVITDADGITHDLTACQSWAIRTRRPIRKRLAATTPLITGQRVIDTLFPLAKGGAAAIPGGFGTGKTMLQHQLAKYSDADVIVYVGCGERGNEMTQVLEEFGELDDPRTGGKMLERTVLIANTSNMPVAAREASIYTGVTIAEYYRDMGYTVAMMADSTSRWAEALREISGRLEEMPAEEGFPAYLPSRLSAFYERAGYVETLAGEEGSVSLIGAVSPQGSDFSEPVTQNTKRFTRCFWALDKSLAYARHYPAVNWTQSYSEYASDETAGWFERHVAPDFNSCRARLMELLADEASLLEIVKLIGASLLADEQKLTLQTARVIRVGFLQQDALSDIDTAVPLDKQYLMMRAILHTYDRASMLIGDKIPVRELSEAGVFDKLAVMKYSIPNTDPEKATAELEDGLFKLMQTIADKYKIG